MTTTSNTSPAVSAIETEFQTYEQYLDAARRGGNFMMFDRPDADELAMLVVPMMYCPNVSTLLDDSNLEALQSALAETDPTGATYQECSFGHWATPFKFMIVTRDSAAHAVAEQCMAALADYPVLDDSDFSEREYAAQCEAISDGLRSLTIEDDGVEVDAEQLAATMFSDMWENDQSALECSNEGCSVSREEVEACLERLGYVYCEDDMTWRPIGQTVIVSDDTDTESQI